MFTASATLILCDSFCSVKNEYGSMSLSDRCEYEGNEDHKVVIEIIRSNFTDFNEKGDRGAIRVKKCELNYNTMNSEANIMLINLTFIHCRASFGGAVFIVSIYESSSTLI